MAKVISFECPETLYKEICSIAATSGCSRSELLRKGVSEICRHYSVKDDDQTVVELIKKALFILEQNKN